MIKHWTKPQLKTLRRLREGFLAGTAGQADYWRSMEDLALYDATFGERIGWKWDAMLRELTLREWRPKCRRILDWGCGTGIASRRVMDRWPGQFESLAVHDRSFDAMQFASRRAREEYPGLEVRTGDTADADTLLVLSHVINEIPERDIDKLVRLARHAGEILWVEAGAHTESRALVRMRELFLGLKKFSVVAPCTHQAACGLLKDTNEHHWCHHFAQPPSDIFQSSSWYEFSLEMGIDLRSLPYSYLVMETALEGQLPMPAGFSRMLGRPREFKGYDKVLSCQAAGVEDLVLQRRDAPALLKALRKEQPVTAFAWELKEGKIVAGTPLVKVASATDEG